MVVGAQVCVVWLLWFRSCIDTSKLLLAMDVGQTKQVTLYRYFEVHHTVTTYFNDDKYVDAKHADDKQPNSTQKVPCDSKRRMESKVAEHPVKLVKISRHYKMKSAWFSEEEY